MIRAKSPGPTPPLEQGRVLESLAQFPTGEQADGLTSHLTWLDFRHEDSTCCQFSEIPPPHTLHRASYTFRLCVFSPKMSSSSFLEELNSDQGN